MYALYQIDSIFGICIQAVFYGLLIIILIDVATHRWQVMACVLLVAISTAIRLLGEPDQRDIQVIAVGALVLCGAMVLYLAMTRILVTRQVEPALISGAVNIYLLSGITWAVALYGIELATPGSYAFSGDGTPTPSDLYYFSFVTLTTLGYGDIQPVSELARASAILESVFGQIFLIVLLGRLVSLQISPQQQISLPTKHTGKQAVSGGHDEV
ncbi:MAG: potassium channel family protein [Planctomycetota bacterium]